MTLEKLSTIIEGMKGHRLPKNFELTGFVGSRDKVTLAWGFSTRPRFDSNGKTIGWEWRVYKWEWSPSLKVYRCEVGAKDKSPGYLLIWSEEGGKPVLAEDNIAFTLWPDCDIYEP